MLAPFVILHGEIPKVAELYATPSWDINTFVWGSLVTGTTPFHLMCIRAHLVARRLRLLAMRCGVAQYQGSLFLLLRRILVAQCCVALGYFSDITHV
jgi:hypothetical protein